MFAVVCVPQESGAVVACRSEQSPIGTEIDRVDVRCVPGKRAQFAPRRYVPNLDRIITAARSQESTVPTKSHLRNTFAVGLEFSYLLASGCVPKQNPTDRLDLHILHELVRIEWLLVLGFL